MFLNCKEKLKYYGKIALFMTFLGSNLYGMNVVVSNIIKKPNIKLNTLFVDNYYSTSLYKKKHQQVFYQESNEKKSKVKNYEKDLYFKEFIELGIEKNTYNGKLTPRGKKKLKQAKRDFYFLYNYSKELKVPFEVVMWIYWSENSLWGERSFTYRYGPMQICKNSMKDSLDYLKRHSKKLYKELYKSFKIGKWKKDAKTNLLAGVAYIAWIREHTPNRIKKDKFAWNLYTTTSYHVGIGLVNYFIRKRDWRIKDFRDWNNYYYISHILDKNLRAVDRKYLVNAYFYFKKFEKNRNPI